MSQSKSGTEDLTTEEWNELVALKEQIEQNPAVVHPDKMELFTNLLVRTLIGKQNPMDGEYKV